VHSFSNVVPFFLFFFPFLKFDHLNACSFKYYLHVEVYGLTSTHSMNYSKSFILISSLWVHTKFPIVNLFIWLQVKCAKFDWAIATNSLFRMVMDPPTTYKLYHCVYLCVQLIHHGNMRVGVSKECSLPP
jgi:hypothetical protein